MDLRKFDIVLPDENKSNPYVLALRYCLINVFGSFLSIMIAALVIYLNTVEWPATKVLIQNGEIIIICISLILGCIYTLYENIGLRSNSVHIIFWTSLFFLIISLIVYVLVVQKQFFTDNVDRANERFEIIKVYSLFIIVWTLATVYFSQVISYKKQNSPLDNRKDDLNDLKKDFNKF